MPRALAKQAFVLVVGCLSVEDMRCRLLRSLGVRLVGSLVGAFGRVQNFLRIFSVNAEATISRRLLGGFVATFVLRLGVFFVSWVSALVAVVFNSVPGNKLCVDLDDLVAPLLDKVVHAVNALKRSRHLLFGDVGPPAVLLTQEEVQLLHLDPLGGALFCSSFARRQIPDPGILSFSLVLVCHDTVEVGHKTSSHIQYKIITLTEYWIKS